jgi:RHS repeat-associated protein
MLSRLTAATNPESGTTCYYYTISGGTCGNPSAGTPCSGDVSAVCRRTDARNVTTTYAYDALNRLIVKSYSDTTTAARYGYDAVAPSGCTLPTLTITNGKGRRTGMCDGAGHTAWSYDEVGNAQVEKRITNGVTNAFTYSYNLDSSVSKILYPSGRTITYQPGGAQRALSAKDVTSGVNYAIGLTAPNYFVSYTPEGTIQSLQNGSNLISTVYYNSRLQPCRMSVQSSGTAPTNCTDATNTGNVLDFTYGFNSGTADNGNVIRVANNNSTGRSVNYSYDFLNRIASAYTDATSGTGCWGETYNIDRYGNLTGITGKSGYSCTQESGLAITVNSANQISGPGTYTYDAAGNLTAQPGPSCLSSVTYDAEGRITSACGVTYYYDGDGRRVRKSGGTLYWYGTSSDPLLETDAAGTLRNEYIFFAGRRIARRDSSGNVEYYVADHLGSARVVTNASGAILESCDYYPYGGSNCVPSSINNYLFTGKERDSESGLDDLGARYYSSQYGRFMTPDPLGGHSEDPQTLNKYTYVRNNPLNLTDPTGLDWYLGCVNADHTSCIKLNDKDKTWVQADKNGNATIVTSDSIRNGNNSATVDQNGVHVTTGGKTYDGVYTENEASDAKHSGDGTDHNPLTLQGDAKQGLGGFTFTFNDNCANTCRASGSFTFAGTPEQARDALKKAGAFDYGFWDILDSSQVGYHAYTDQFRFASGPSLHVSVPWNVLPGQEGLPTINPAYTVPARGDAHVEATVGSSHFFCANFNMGCGKSSIT